MLPSLFISHGSPALGIMNNRFSNFFKNLSFKFEKPKYIIIVSAHYLSKELSILSKESPEIIYDFYGFPKELYDKKYKAKNDIKKVKSIKKLLEENNIKILEDGKKDGYDHGVWIPLSFMYEKADIPIIQISLPLTYSSKELYILGQTLQKLREECLIIGSGGLTHNLHDINNEINSDVKEYAKVFRDYICKNLEEKNIQKLLDFTNNAPKLKENHPTLEHLMPLFFSLGASISKECEVLNNSFMHGNLAMDTILFRD